MKYTRYYNLRRYSNSFFTHSFLYTFFNKNNVDQFRNIK